MTPRLAPVAAFLTLALALCALRATAEETSEDRSTVVGAARAFHAAVESGELARIARFGCTVKGPFTEPELKEAAKSVFGTLGKIRGRSWEFGEEVDVKDLPGGRRLEVKTSPTSALSLTAVAFDGHWCFLSVDELDLSAFTPRDPPVVDPAPVIAPAPTVDPEAEKAVKEVVAMALKLPAPGDDASSWLLWRSHGIHELPRGLVGDLHDVLASVRALGARPSVEVFSVGGKPPHRHARVRVAVSMPVLPAWILLLVEAEGWKVARADVDLVGPVLGQERSDIKVLIEAAEALLASIDAANAKDFAAWSARIRPESRIATEADVKAQLEVLHAKYGARPRKIGRPAPDAAGMAVPVLFGDGEDLLYLVFTDENRRWRLATLSEGAPADFVERGAAPPK
jgi:hypothetical protein